MKRFHSGWPFKIGMLLIVFLAFVICRNYGERLEFNKGEIYYKSPITDSEAKKLGEYLIEKGFFDGNPKSLQLVKQDEKYKIRFVIKEEMRERKNILNSLEQISALTSSAVFDDSPVEVDICDNRFNTVSEIKGIKYGKSLEFGKDVIFYDESISKEHADNLGNYLISIGTFMDLGIMIRLEKTDSVYLIHLPVQENMDEDPSYIEAVKIVAKAISEEIFSETQVDVHLCDDLFETLKVVRSID